MEVNEELVRKVARTARLDLTPAEIERFIPELKEVLENFQKISKIDTDRVEPSFQPIDFPEHTEDDNPKKCLDQQDAIKLAPNKEGYIKGPKVL